MIRLIFMTTAALLAAFTAHAAALDGVYDTDPRLCAISAQSTTRLTISGARLTLYETECNMGALRNGQARLACADGGRVWRSRVGLEPAENGVILGDRHFRRCD